MKSNQPHIICAYEFNGNGGGETLSDDVIAQKVKAHKLAWVHLDADHPLTREWLHENVDYLDNLIIDSLLQEETRPRLNELKDGMMVILRGVNLHKGADPEDMISIRLWIDEHRIISTQRRPLKAVADIRAALEDGRGPKSAADFMVTLTTRLIERMEPVLRELDDRTDSIEESVIENPDVSERSDLNDIRRQAILMRRYIAPQKDVIAAMRGSNIRWFDTNHKRQLFESLDRITRYIEDLDAIRDRAQVVKDELANILADRMNKNVYILSIISAIFLPLGFLTGLLGINVGGIPGAQYNAAFWIVVAICLLFAGGMLRFFKHKGWL